MGVTNNHICIRKGIVYLISLYFTFREEKIIPSPNDRNTNGMIRTGQNSKFIVNGI